jgi:hypothetical protein
MGIQGHFVNGYGFNSPSCHHNPKKNSQSRLNYMGDKNTTNTNKVIKKNQMNACKRVVHLWLIYFLKL